MIQFHVTKIELQKKTKTLIKFDWTATMSCPWETEMITACGPRTIGWHLLTIAGAKTLQTARVVFDSAVPLPHGTGPIPQRGHKGSTLFTMQGYLAKEDMRSSCGKQLWPIVVYILNVLSKCRNVQACIVVAPFGAITRGAGPSTQQRDDFEQPHTETLNWIMENTQH